MTRTSYIISWQLVLLVEETGDNHRLVTGQWFYPGPPVSSANKTDMTEILLKVVFNTIKQTSLQLDHDKNKLHYSYIMTRTSYITARS
jgi:hypothetical protein